MESLSFIQDLLGPYLIMIRVQSAGEDKIKNFANYQIQFLNKSIQIIKYLKNKILKQEYNSKISFYIFGK